MSQTSIGQRTEGVSPPADDDAIIYSTTQVKFNYITGLKVDTTRRGSYDQQRTCLSGADADLAKEYIL